jgi:hypothetical protein
MRNIFSEGSIEQMVPDTYGLIAWRFQRVSALIPARLVSMPAQPRPQAKEHMERHGAISIDWIKNVRLGIEHRVRTQPQLPMVVLHKVAYSAEGVRADAK